MLHIQNGTKHGNNLNEIGSLFETSNRMINSEQWCFTSVLGSLTSTNRVRTTVSIWPILGTVATSFPHSTAVFSASALTFTLTWPVCTCTGLYWLPLPVTLSHFLCAKAKHLFCFSAFPSHYPPCSSIPPLCFPSSPFPSLSTLINPHLLPY